MKRRSKKTSESPLTTRSKSLVFSVVVEAEEEEEEANLQQQEEEMKGA